MPQDNNEKLHNDLKVNRSCTSNDLTTNVAQRLTALTQAEQTARVKQMITDAGGAN